MSTRKHVSTKALSSAELQLQAWQRGYKAALADLIEFAAQSRAEPFETIQRFGEAKRGRKLPAGRRSYEDLHAQRMQEFWTYQFAKSLVENNGLSIAAACRQAKDKYYGNHCDETVEKIFYRMQRMDRAGKMWVPDSEQYQRERRWRRFINELDTYPPIYGK